jgi:hypothetical protein
MVAAEGTQVRKNLHAVASTHFNSARWGKEMERRALVRVWYMAGGGVGVRPMSNVQTRRPVGEAGDRFGGGGMGHRGDRGLGCDLL